MFNMTTTIINLILTAITVTSTVVSIYYTKKQTKIMEKQLEAALKPDFPTTCRLESIANAIRNLNQNN